jgi:DNA-binding PadR family transcriptional regulator
MPRRVSPFWRTWIPFQTSLFIRDYLLEHGRAYPYEVFKALRERLLAEEYPRRGSKWGSYQNIRNYFYWLSKLGLIKPVQEVPSDNVYLKNRRYYALTEKGLKTPPTSVEWRNPIRALYPESWERWH